MRWFVPLFPWGAIWGAVSVAAVSHGVVSATISLGSFAFIMGASAAAAAVAGLRADERSENTDEKTEEEESKE